MTKWLNAYTLIPLIVVFIVFLNTVEVFLLNGGTALWTLGVILLCSCLYFVVYNFFKVVAEFLIWMEER